MTSHLPSSTDKLRPPTAPTDADAALRWVTPRQHNLQLLSIAQTRAAEAAAYSHMASFALMARAGETAWHWARMQVPADDNRSWLVLAGTGNNGGDAYVLARHARASGCRVQLFATGDASASAFDALQARREYEATGGEVLDSRNLHLLDASQWACIIDGLLGIGSRSEPTGEVARLIACVNAAAHPVTLALDVPSGLNADTGLAPDTCLQATHTLTFIAGKPGLFTADGPDRCGETCVAPLGLPYAEWRSAAPVQPDPGLLDPVCAFSDRTLRTWWPTRLRNTHKGQQGDVVIVGGESGMAGAAVLAGRAAVQMGAGRVFLGLLDGPHPPGYDPLQPELMLRAADTLTGHGGVWVIGPGAGQSERFQTLFRNWLRHWQDHPAQAPIGLVLDADALNLIAADPALAVRLQHLPMPRLVTPHPLEAGRLLSRSAQSVQSDRLAHANALARQLDAVVILKGQGSVVSDGQRCAINLSGGPALASGGTGDVLAGAAGALLAQCLGLASAPAATRETVPAAAWRAALLATHLHGATCDALPGERKPPRLLFASELPARMRMCLE